MEKIRGKGKFSAWNEIGPSECVMEGESGEQPFLDTLDTGLTKNHIEVCSPLWYRYPKFGDLSHGLYYTY